MTPMFNFLPGALLQFEYTNHRNVVEERHVEFRGMQMGANDYYPAPTLLLFCHDYDRDGPRSFAVSNINAASLKAWTPPADKVLKESNLVTFARKEMAIVYGHKEPDGEYDAAGHDAVLELIRVFANQGHSGFSAAWTTNTVERLMRFEPLTPLTGEDSEWNEVGEEDGVTTFQNNRCSHVFKNGKDGHAYDIQGRVFVEEGEDQHSFTGSGSRKWVTFPYVPTIEYVKVNAEGQPLEGPTREELATQPPA